MTPQVFKGAVCGLAAAALFGASAPLSKTLLPALPPLALSGLLYLGAALGLGLGWLVRRARGSAPREAGLRGRDALPLVAIVVVGGMASPFLMLTGLERVSGVTGALLLNLEAPATILIAVAFFREHLGRRAALAAALIVTAAAWLGLRGAGGRWGGDMVGVLAIAGACAGWGLDNNLSQWLSLKDPQTVVLIKTGGAGVVMLTLAALLGHAPPLGPPVALALLLGSVSYGASILLDMYALRFLGAAREAAFFATAPFMGAVLALPALGERPGVRELGAAALMVAGVALLIRERHSHVHTHEPIEHEHLHFHDEHHQHAHGDDAGSVEEPHSHPHRHDPITHDHPHVPDAHHRHRH